MKRTIKQTFIFIGTLAAALILLGYSLSIEVKGKEKVSLKDKITFIEIESPNKFEVRFKENGRKTGIVVFESNKDNFRWEITIKKGDGTVTQIIEDRYCGFISEVGVVDYDEESNEHFVLFHPDDMYSWPTVLKLIGSYLLIGTRGEGLAIINLQSFYLKRYRLSPPNDEIGSLQVLDSQIVVNEQEKIDLPDF